jgi:hypothetical protein
VEGILAGLVILACPVGMGLMMWFMGRGMRSERREREGASLEELRAEQRRIEAQLDRLERAEQATDGRVTVARDAPPVDPA